MASRELGGLWTIPGLAHVSITDDFEDPALCHVTLADLEGFEHVIVLPVEDLSTLSLRTLNYYLENAPTNTLPGSSS